MAFMPGIPEFEEFFADEWKKMTKLPVKDRVVRSLLGRERHFPWRPSAAVERQFRVTWPQQIEADLMKTAMVRLDRIFRRRNMKARIVMMIHDALWVECPEDEAEQVRHLVEKNDDYGGQAGRAVGSGYQMTTGTFPVSSYRGHG